MSLHVMVRLNLNAYQRILNWQPVMKENHRMQLRFKKGVCNKLAGEF